MQPLQAICPPVMTTAVLISGGVSNLASLRAFRDSLITNLIGKSEDVEFHLFFYVRLPSDMDKEELDQELKRTGSDRVWIHRITIEDESNTKNEAQIRVAAHAAQVGMCLRNAAGARW